MTAVRGTTATKRKRVEKVGNKTIYTNVCDLKKLAEIYSNWGNVPKVLGDKKAMEISLLAKAYLRLRMAPQLKPKGV